jgi:hypothetical protein
MEAKVSYEKRILPKLHKWAFEPNIGCVGANNYVKFVFIEGNMVAFDKESQARILKVAELRREGKEIDEMDERIDFVMDMHPEYDELWEMGELACYPQEVEGKIVNPFVHTVLHVKIAQQILLERPPFVLETQKRLEEAGMDSHEVLHVIIQEYANIHFDNFRNDRGFDELAYYNQLKNLNFKKNED